MHLWLITRVEDEDMWKTKTGETRGKKTRTLEDEDEEPVDEEEHEDARRGGTQISLKSAKLGNFPNLAALTRSKFGTEPNTPAPFDKRKALSAI